MHVCVDVRTGKYAGSMPMRTVSSATAEERKRKKKEEREKKEERRKKKEERRKKKEERRKKKERKQPGGLGPEDIANSLATEGNALEHAPQRHQPQGTSRLKHP
jgi:hypothetical protein